MWISWGIYITYQIMSPPTPKNNVFPPVEFKNFTIKDFFSISFVDVWHNRKIQIRIKSQQILIPAIYCFDYLSLTYQVRFVKVYFYSFMVKFMIFLKITLKNSCRRVHWGLRPIFDELQVAALVESQDWDSTFPRCLLHRVPAQEWPKMFPLSSWG